MLGPAAGPADLQYRLSPAPTSTDIALGCNLVLAPGDLPVRHLLSVLPAHPDHIPPNLQLINPSPNLALAYPTSAISAISLRLLDTLFRRRAPLGLIPFPLPSSLCGWDSRLTRAGNQ